MKNNKTRAINTAFSYSTKSNHKQEIPVLETKKEVKFLPLFRIQKLIFLFLFVFT
ncbi:MAG: hypothetical protein U0354_05140 [Candidatus Sericytochromatia bacterium]